MALLMPSERVSDYLLLSVWALLLGVGDRWRWWRSSSPTESLERESTCDKEKYGDDLILIFFTFLAWMERMSRDTTVQEGEDRGEVGGERGRGGKSRAGAGLIPTETNSRREGKQTA